MSIHFDSIKMPKVVKTADGYLRGEVVVSRAGVFKYKNADGSIRGELRHPDDIFKQESLNTLKMIPITNNHPPEFVDASNAHKYQVGYTGEHYDVLNDKVIVSITVTHQDAIDAIMAGKLELSMGYDVDLKEEQGTYKQEKYDFRQLSPKYNHLAIVEKGRAGSEARFRFDQALELVESTDINTNHSQTKKEKNPMSENKNDDLDTSRLDALVAEKELLVEKMTNLQSRLDLADKSWEKTKKELKTEKETKAESVIEQRVLDRVELFLQASPFLQDIEAYIKHTDREIMEATMNSTRTDNIDCSHRDDSHIKGMFETFVATNVPKHPNAVGTFGVLKRHNDMTNQNLSMHDQIAKQLKDNFYETQNGGK